MSLQQRNIARVQELLGEFLAGRPEGYLAGVSPDIKGSVLAGLIPGAESINGKEHFMEVMNVMPDFMETKKFEPCNFRAVGDDVLFNVNWELVWKPTGKTIETTAIVRKVLKDGLICEKYHMIDTEAVTGEKSPHDAAAVERVQSLLGEIAAGRPEGYMAGVAEDVHASMLGGLIPGAEAITNKDEFAAVMAQMDKYMETKKFEPCNFRACPDGNMMFNVNWELVWKETGKTIQTTAIVRKVVKDGLICEKYHLMDVEAVTGKPSPRDVITS